MSRQKSRLANAEAGPKVDMSSMIDISFLLLIFFLVATSLRILEKDVPMSVAGVPQGRDQIAKLDPVKLALRGDGSILVGSDEDGLLIDASDGENPIESLKHYLRSFVVNPGLGAEPAVLLTVENEVKHQRFTEVMACLNYLQLDQVAIVD